MKANRILKKPNTYEMVLLLQDEFIMFQLHVKKQCCSLLLPDCIVFEIRHDFCQNRINSTQLLKDFLRMLKGAKLQYFSLAPCCQIL